MQQVWNRIFNSLGDVSEKWNDGNSTNNDIREFSGNTKKMIFGVSQYWLKVLVWVGVFYIAKLTASAVLDLWDGVQAFILPKIWKTDLRRYLPA